MRAVLQRRCACGAKGEEGGRCSACRAQEDKARLQRRAARENGGLLGFAFGIVNAVMRRPGRAADAGARSGRDFSHVRIQDGALTACAAAALGLDGWTAGPRIAAKAAATVARGVGNGADASAHASPPPLVADVLRSPGRPLGSAVRSGMEARFGHDFGQVEVHTGPAPAEAARAVGALAYAVGRHVVFAEGQYAPDTRKGLGLLAHELAHVVQQGNASPDLGRLVLDEPGAGPLEREAERARVAVESGGEVGALSQHAAASMQRLPGSPAGGCGICYGTARDAGIEAHARIAAAFLLLNGRVQTEHPFPLLPSPTDRMGGGDGRLDLAMLTGPTTIEIGEIKPANPQGLLQGDLDLMWYEDQLRALGFTVGRMSLPPPLTGIPFPTRANPPCLLVQQLFVDPPAHGIYTYWCMPDAIPYFSQGCCGRREPVRQRQRQPERARERRREPEAAGKPAPEAQPAPVPQAAMQQIRDFLRQVAETGENAEAAARRFLERNPQLVYVIAGVAITIFVATIAEDIATFGAGIADDPATLGIAYALWRVAMQMRPA